MLVVTVVLAVFILSVAAGAGEVVTGLGFNGITTMQEMTSSICSSAASGLEGRLQDTRDNKIYWVAKLKDNNCWMTQNLDLDLSTSTALTSAKSDVSNWTPGYNTQTTPSGWGSNNTYQKSYDPGNYYYTTPSTQNQCANGTGLSACTSNGWKADVSNNDIADLIDTSTWASTNDLYFVNTTSYVGTDGQSICSKESGSMLGDARYSQCQIYYYMYDKAYEHYHAGNYYTYAAATAGTAPSDAGTASSSICPKGWQLPTSNSTTVSKSFGYMLTQYGVQSALTAGNYDIRLAPLYFVYGGYVNVNGIYNQLSGAGNFGFYWSSTVNDASHAYSLYFTTSVGPSNDNLRFLGFSVRCVAR